MTEHLLSLGANDLAVLFLAALAAGCVRGFTGFGTAMVYLPLAGMVLDPVSAITTLIMMDILGPVPIVPKVLAHAHRKDLLRLLAGTVIAAPLGLAALFVMNPDLFRVLVSSVAILMLAGLLLGWRYAGSLGPRAVFGTGLMAGFLGGAVGMPGPPVIFIYMASPHPAQVIRANTTLFLLGYDILLVAFLALASRLDPAIALTGLLLTVPNMLGNLIGSALFVPEREKLYRSAAYALIFGVALAGMPIWT
ncbi:sulfite exporter TauE/SafE family protein [Ruegeria hyattellae]|uniref:sulfite exporter TauE/SafE family protein n=1 Tax=Ruegeria hyattellae TaxID=3233337 RepID=UPI00355BA78D